MTDDDIRDLLRTKAREATVSADAWDKIAVRLQEAHAPVRHLPRRLAALATAAAVVAGIVVLANRPHDDGPVTQATTTTAGPGTTARQVDPEFVRSVVEDWVHARLPGVVMGRIHQTVHDDDGTVTVRFTGGELATELVLRPTNGGQGLEVASASSDLLLIDNPTYDGHELVAEVIPAVVGRMTVTYVIDDREVPGAERDVSHEAEHLGYPIEGASAVAISEQPAAALRDPATVTGSYVAVWPATDSVGLASLQRQADDGRRDDLLDPKAVAGGFLSEQLPRNETSTSFEVGDLRRVDASLGTVQYTLSDGSSGQISLRNMGGTKPIWFVSEVGSSLLEVRQVRHEPADLVADVHATADGTLTWVGATPVAVQAGQTVGISRHDGPTVETSAPVVVRLMDGNRTLAIVAQLP